jgi:TrpR family trp operon transcriptional repressor
MAVDDGIIAENITEMAQTLVNSRDPVLVEEFLFSIFTPSEADEIAKRWALVKDLARGLPQREIAKGLGLSLCKITRGSRELKKEGSAFRKMLQLAGYEVPEHFSSRRGPKPRAPKA